MDSARQRVAFQAPARDAGVPPKREELTWTHEGTGKTWPTTAVGQAGRAGHARGSKPYTDAQKADALRGYLRNFNGQYRLAKPGHQPKRGDLALFLKTDDQGNPQPQHVAMFTGKAFQLIHNPSGGPRVGSMPWSYTFGMVERAIFEYVGPPLEER